jgi:ribonuclease-3
VLELAIARTLYDRFPDASEGRLAKIRAHVVSRQSCAAVARTLDLGAVLVARAQDVPGPELHRISLSRNVLAALLEAAIAADLEYGYDVSRRRRRGLRRADQYASTGRRLKTGSRRPSRTPAARSGTGARGRRATTRRRSSAPRLIDGGGSEPGEARRRRPPSREAAAEALAALGAPPVA